jgi:hypothetical protein
MRRVLGKASPSMVVACIALAVALSGVGMAATQLARNSVGSRQIINNSIQRIDLNRKTVTALKGRTGARGRQGPAGPAGANGAAGASGAKGDPGMSGYEYKSASSASDSTDFKSVEATCSAGKKAVGGGGFLFSNDATAPFALVRSQPGTSTWLAQAKELSVFAGNWSLSSYAICVNVAS